MKTKIATNKPFTAPNAKILLYVPENVQVTVNMSADGINYDEIADPIDGSTMIQINDVKCGAWFKFASDTQTDLDVIL